MLIGVPPGIRSEVDAMNIKTRRYFAIFITCTATLALYGTAAYRVEQARQQPRVAASCGVDQCIPHNATLNALR
jgi:uncharacterized membrane protein YjjP (DUF1212 family)